MKTDVHNFFMACSVYFSSFFVLCAVQTSASSPCPHVAQVDEVPEKPARQGGLHK
jgi:hypothetical protein